MNKLVHSAEDAIRDMHDGAVLLVGGFGLTVVLTIANYEKNGCHYH